MGVWLVYGLKRKFFIYWDGKRIYIRELEWCLLEIDRLMEMIVLVFNGKKKLLVFICLLILFVFFIVCVKLDVDLVLVGIRKLMD